MIKYLFKISQDVNNDYDTYSDAIVCAASVEDARLIHPDGYPIDSQRYDIIGTWANSKDVKVELVGVADESIELNTIVCASFHAG